MPDSLRDLTRDRASLETEVAKYRRWAAAIATLVNNPTYDLDTRLAIATALGIPAPQEKP